MFSYKNIELSDRKWIDSLLLMSEYQGAEYCFTTLYIWANLYNSLIARYNDMLIVRSESPNELFYSVPAGHFSEKELAYFFDNIRKEGASMSKKVTITGITEDTLPMIQAFLHEEPTPDRNSFDYIYLSDDLISLKGKKYQPKRNHIKHFLSQYEWIYEDVTPENVEECYLMNEQWCKENYCIHNLSKQSEACATRRALRNFESLNLKGGLIRVAGEIVAFTLGEKLNSNTFLIHVEKAFARIDGAYPMINREFIKAQASTYKYVNREDDAGNDGLRQAKLSYNPVYLIEKKYISLD